MMEEINSAYKRYAIIFKSTEEQMLMLLSRVSLTSHAKNTLAVNAHIY